MKMAISLGTALRNARKARGYSLRELAEIAGMPNGQLSQIENDRREPKFITIAPIAEALGISLDDLAKETGYQERSRSVPQSARELILQRSQIKRITAELDKLAKGQTDLKREIVARDTKKSKAALRAELTGAARHLDEVTNEYELLLRRSGLPDARRHPTTAGHGRQAPRRKK